MRSKKNTAITPGFRALLWASALVTYLLILVGVIVRVTGTSSGCPDWPICFGVLSPPETTSALIPYVHRLVAALAAFTLLAAGMIAWRRYRRRIWIFRPLVAAGALITLEILLGGVVSYYEALAWMTAVHLGLALVIQALVLTATVSEMVSDPSITDRQRVQFRSPFARLSLWTLGATFVLLLSGSILATSGATYACATWPLCQPWLVAGTLAGWINFAHRLISILSGILMLAAVFKAWRTQRSQTGILVATTVATVLYGAQVLMGIVEVGRDYPAYLLGLHAATAAGIWGALVIQTTLTGLAKRSGQEEWEEAGFKERRTGLAKDFLLLTKPVVVALLLVTTFAGMVVGAKQWPSFWMAFWTLLGGAMAAGGSGAINQYIDRYDDKKMQRTAGRPIPSGRLTPGEGLAFGVAIALGSFYVMAAFVNFLAALLTLAGVIYYVLIYSILLKKTTVQNIVIGGGAGAIPPLVGWAAATGELNIPSLFLFAVVFMWTPPHFWTLALVRRNDYARAGVPMLPVVRGVRETRWQIFLYTLELVALTLVLPLFGLGGGVYFVSAAVLGGALLFSAWRVWRGEGNKVAWQMYRHSSMYLAFLFVALVVDALV